MARRRPFAAPGWRTALLAGVLALAACAALPTPAERLAQARQRLDAQGWQPLQLPAGRTALPPLFAADAGRRAPLLWIYLEGDGLAWLDGRTPSDDPSPVRPVALELALAQPAGAAAYLARPCQFAAAASAPACTPALWTARRLAPESIAAADAAVNALKQRAGAQDVVLVGYSGGGALAALLAARRDDVRGLVTVAGNLDLGAWLRLHRLSPMEGSLDPALAWGALQAVPQLHWVGARDSIVPPSIAASYADHFPAGRRPAVRTIDDADHGCCWSRTWATRWRESAQALGLDAR